MTLALLVTTGGCALAPLRPNQSSSTATDSTSTTVTTASQATAPADPEAVDSGQDLKFHANATTRQRFQVHIDFGRVFESEGNYDSAVMEYQEALKVFKDRKQGGLKPADEALAHRRIGGALDKLGRFPQAEEHYKQALALDPHNPKIWNDAGYSYYLQGRFAQAQQALLTGNKLAPEDPKIRVNLGLTLAAAGNTTDALPLLSETAGDAVGHLNLGYLLAANNHFDLARHEYETALAMRPDLEIAKRALAQLDRQQYGTGGTSLPPIQVAAATKPKSSGTVDTNLVHATTTKPNPPQPDPARPKIPPPVIPDFLKTKGGYITDSPPTIPPSIESLPHF